MKKDLENIKNTKMVDKYFDELYGRIKDRRRKVAAEQAGLVKTQLTSLSHQRNHLTKSNQSGLTQQIDLLKEAYDKRSANFKEKMKSMETSGYDDAISTSSANKTGATNASNFGSANPRGYGVGPLPSQSSPMMNETQSIRPMSSQPARPMSSQPASPTMLGGGFPTQMMSPMAQTQSIGSTQPTMVAGGTGVMTLPLSRNMLMPSKKKTYSKKSKSAKYLMVAGVLGATGAIAATTAVLLMKSSKSKNDNSILDETKFNLYNKFLSEIQADTFLSDSNKQALLVSLKNRLEQAHSLVEAQAIYDNSGQMVLREKQQQAIDIINNLLKQDELMDQAQKDAILRDAQSRVANMHDNKEFQDYIGRTNPTMKRIFDDLLEIAKDQEIVKLEAIVDKVGFKDKLFVTTIKDQINRHIKSMTAYEEVQNIESNIWWMDLQFKQLLPQLKLEVLNEFETLVNASNCSPLEKREINANGRVIVNSAATLAEVPIKFAQAKRLLLAPAIADATVLISQIINDSPLSLREKMLEISRVSLALNDAQDEASLTAIMNAEKNKIAQLVRDEAFEQFKVDLGGTKLSQSDKDALIRNVQTDLAEPDPQDAIAKLSAHIQSSPLTSSEKTQLISLLTNAIGNAQKLHQATSTPATPGQFDHAKESALTDITARIEATSLPRDVKDALIASVSSKIAKSLDESEIQDAIDETVKQLIVEDQKVALAGYQVEVDATGLITSTKAELLNAAKFAIDAATSDSEINLALTHARENLLSEVKKLEIQNIGSMLKGIALPELTKAGLLSQAKIAINGASDVAAVNTIVVSIKDNIISETRRGYLADYTALVRHTTLTEAIKNDLVQKANETLTAATTLAELNAALDTINERLADADIATGKTSAISAFEAIVHGTDLSATSQTKLVTDAMLAINAATTGHEIAAAVAIANAALISQMKSESLSEFKTLVNGSMILDSSVKATLINEAQTTINAATNMPAIVKAVSDANTNFWVEVRQAAIAKYTNTVMGTNLPDAVKSKLISDATNAINAVHSETAINNAIANANNDLISKVKDYTLEDFIESVSATTLSSMEKTQLIKEATQAITSATDLASIASQLATVIAKLTMLDLSAGKASSIAAFKSQVNIADIAPAIKAQIIDSVVKAINAATDAADVATQIGNGNIKLITEIRKSAIAKFQAAVSASQLSPEEKNRQISAASSALAGATSLADINKKVEEINSKLMTVVRQQALTACETMINAITGLDSAIKTHLLEHARELITAAGNIEMVNAAVAEISSALTTQDLGSRKTSVISSYRAKVMATQLTTAAKTNLVSTFLNEVSAARDAAAVNTAVADAEARLLAEVQKVELAKAIASIGATSLPQATKDALIAEISSSIGAARDVAEIAQKIQEINEKMVLDIARSSAISQYEAHVKGVDLSPVTQSRLITEATLAITNAVDGAAINSQVLVAEGKLLTEAKTYAKSKYATAVDATQLSDATKKTLIDQANAAIDAVNSLSDLGSVVTDINNSLTNEIRSWAKTTIVAEIEHEQFGASDKDTLLSETKHAIDSATTNAIITSKMNEARAKLLAFVKVEDKSAFRTAALATDVNQAIVAALITEANTNIDAANNIADVHAALATANTKLLSEIQKHAIEAYKVVVNGTAIDNAIKATLIADATSAIDGATTLSRVNAAIGDANDKLLDEVKKYEIGKLKIAVHASTDLDATKQAEVIADGSVAINKATSLAEIATIVAANNDKLGIEAIRSAKLDAFTHDVRGSSLPTASQDKLIDDARLAINAATTSAAVNTALNNANQQFLAALISSETTAYEAKVNAANISDAEKTRLISLARSKFAAVQTKLALSAAVTDANDNLGSSVLEKAKADAITAFTDLVHSVGAIAAADQAKLIADASRAIHAASDLAAVKSAATTHETKLLEAAKVASLAAFSAIVNGAAIDQATKDKLIKETETLIDAATSVAQVGSQLATSESQFLPQNKQAAIAEFTRVVRATHLDQAIKDKLIDDASTSIRAATDAAKIDEQVAAANKLLLAALVKYEKDHYVSRVNAETYLRDAGRASLISGADTLFANINTKQELQKAIDDANAALLAASLVVMKEEKNKAFSAAANAAPIEAATRTSLIAATARAINAATNASGVNAAFDQANADLLAAVRQHAVDLLTTEIKASPLTTAAQTKLITDESAKINAAASIADVTTALDASRTKLLDEAKKVVQAKMNDMINALQVPDAEKTKLIEAIKTKIAASTTMADLQKILDAGSAEIKASAFADSKAKALDAFTTSVKASALTEDAKIKLIDDLTKALLTAKDDAAVTTEVALAKANLLSAVQVDEIQKFSTLVRASNLPADVQNRLITSASQGIHNATDLDGVKAAVLSAHRALALAKFTDVVSSTSIPDAIKATLIANANTELAKATTEAELTTKLASADASLLPEYKKAIIAKLTALIQNTKLSATVQNNLLSAAKLEINAGTSVSDIDTKMRLWVLKTITIEQIDSAAHGFTERSITSYSDLRALLLSLPGVHDGWNPISAIPQTFRIVIDGVTYLAGTKGAQENVDQGIHVVGQNGNDLVAIMVTDAQGHAGILASTNVGGDNLGFGVAPADGKIYFALGSDAQSVKTPTNKVDVTNKLKFLEAAPYFIPADVQDKISNDFAAAILGLGTEAEIRTSVSTYEDKIMVEVRKAFIERFTSESYGVSSTSAPITNHDLLKDAILRLSTNVLGWSPLSKVPKGTLIVLDGVEYSIGTTGMGQDVNKEMYVDNQDSAKGMAAIVLKDAQGHYHLLASINPGGAGANAGIVPDDGKIYLVDSISDQGVKDANTHRVVVQNVLIKGTYDIGTASGFIPEAARYKMVTEFKNAVGQATSVVDAINALKAAEAALLAEVKKDASDSFATLVHSLAITDAEKTKFITSTTTAINNAKDIAAVIAALSSAHQALSATELAAKKSVDKTTFADDVRASTIVSAADQAALIAHANTAIDGAANLSALDIVMTNENAALLTKIKEATISSFEDAVHKTSLDQTTKDKLIADARTAINDATDATSVATALANAQGEITTAVANAKLLTAKEAAIAKFEQDVYGPSTPIPGIAEFRTFIRSVVGANVEWAPLSVIPPRLRVIIDGVTYTAGTHGPFSMADKGLYIDSASDSSMALIALDDAQGHSFILGITGTGGHNSNWNGYAPADSKFYLTPVSDNNYSGTNRKEVHSITFKVPPIDVLNGYIPFATQLKLVSDARTAINAAADAAAIQAKLTDAYAALLPEAKTAAKAAFAATIKATTIAAADQATLITAANQKIDAATDITGVAAALASAQGALTTATAKATYAAAVHAATMISTADQATLISDANTAMDGAANATALAAAVTTANTNLLAKAKSSALDTFTKSVKAITTLTTAEQDKIIADAKTAIDAATDITGVATALTSAQGKLTTAAAKATYAAAVHAATMISTADQATLISNANTAMDGAADATALAAAVTTANTNLLTKAKSSALDAFIHTVSQSSDEIKSYAELRALIARFAGTDRTGWSWFWVPKSLIPTDLKLLINGELYSIGGNGGNGNADQIVLFPPKDGDMIVMSLINSQGQTYLLGSTASGGEKWDWNIAPADGKMYITQGTSQYANGKTEVTQLAVMGTAEGNLKTKLIADARTAIDAATDVAGVAAKLLTATREAAIAKFEQDVYGPSTPIPGIAEFRAFIRSVVGANVDWAPLSVIPPRLRVTIDGVTYTAGTHGPLTMTDKGLYIDAASETSMALLTLDDAQGHTFVLGITGTGGHNSDWNGYAPADGNFYLTPVSDNNLSGTNKKVVHSIIFNVPPIDALSGYIPSATQQKLVGDARTAINAAADAAAVQAKLTDAYAALLPEARTAAKAAFAATIKATTIAAADQATLITTANQKIDAATDITGVAAALASAQGAITIPAAKATYAAAVHAATMISAADQAKLISDANTAMDGAAGATALAAAVATANTNLLAKAKSSALDALTKLIKSTTLTTADQDKKIADAKTAIDAATDVADVAAKLLTPTREAAIAKFELDVYGPSVPNTPIPGIAEFRAFIRSVIGANAEWAPLSAIPSGLRVSIDGVTYTVGTHGPLTMPNKGLYIDASSETSMALLALDDAQGHSFVLGITGTGGHNSNWNGYAPADGKFYLTPVSDDVYSGTNRKVVQSIIFKVPPIDVISGYIPFATQLKLVSDAKTAFNAAPDAATVQAKLTDAYTALLPEIRTAAKAAFTCIATQAITSDEIKSYADLHALVARFAGTDRTGWTGFWMSKASVPTDLKLLINGEVYSIGGNGGNGNTAQIVHFPSGDSDMIVMSLINSQGETYLLSSTATGGNNWGWNIAPADGKIYIAKGTSQNGDGKTVVTQLTAVGAAAGSMKAKLIEDAKIAIDAATDISGVTTALASAQGKLATVVSAANAKLLAVIKTSAIAKLELDVYGSDTPIPGIAEFRRFIRSVVGDNVEWGPLSSIPSRIKVTIDGVTYTAGTRGLFGMPDKGLHIEAGDASMALMALNDAQGDTYVLGITGFNGHNSGWNGFAPADGKFYLTPVFDNNLSGTHKKEVHSIIFKVPPIGAISGYTLSADRLKLVSDAITAINAAADGAAVQAKLTAVYAVLLPDARTAAKAAFATFATTIRATAIAAADQATLITAGNQKIDAATTFADVIAKLNEAKTSLLAAAHSAEIAKFTGDVKRAEFGIPTATQTKLINDATTAINATTTLSDLAAKVADAYATLLADAKMNAKTVYATAVHAATQVAAATQGTLITNANNAFDAANSVAALLTAITKANAALFAENFAITVNAASIDAAAKTKLIEDAKTATGGAADAAALATAEATANANLLSKIRETALEPFIHAVSQAHLDEVDEVDSYPELHTLIASFAGTDRTGWNGSWMPKTLIPADFKLLINGEFYSVGGQGQGGDATKLVHFPPDNGDMIVISLVNSQGQTYMLGSTNWGGNNWGWNIAPADGSFYIAQGTDTINPSSKTEVTQFAAGTPTQNMKIKLIEDAKTAFANANTAAALIAAKADAQAKLFSAIKNAAIQRYFTSVREAVATGDVISDYAHLHEVIWGYIRGANRDGWDGFWVPRALIPTNLKFYINGESYSIGGVGANGNANRLLHFPVGNTDLIIVSLINSRGQTYLLGSTESGGTNWGWDIAPPDGNVYMTRDVRQKPSSKTQVTQIVAGENHYQPDTITRLTTNFMADISKATNEAEVAEAVQRAKTQIWNSRSGW